MSENYSDFIKQVFNGVCENYKNFFNEKIFPFIPKDKGDPYSFSERNLTFNFCQTYLFLSQCNNGKDIFVFQELDVKYFCTGTRGHVDSLIYDKKRNALIFIEAKRVAHGSGKQVDDKTYDKMKALGEDLLRINNIKYDRHKIPVSIQRIVANADIKTYAIALVDYWEREKPFPKLENLKGTFEKFSGRTFFQIDKFGNDYTYYLNYSFKEIPDPNIGILR